MRFLRNDKSWQYQFQYQKSISISISISKINFLNHKLAQIFTNLKTLNYETLNYETLNSKKAF
jgi:hypothetical protein